MKQNMIIYVVTTLINTFIKTLNIEDLKRYIDNLIDSVEKTVEESPNKLDDTILPGLRLVRELFAIPDFPDK